MEPVRCWPLDDFPTEPEKWLHRFRGVEDKYETHIL